MQTRLAYLGNTVFLRNFKEKKTHASQVTSFFCFWQLFLLLPSIQLLTFRFVASLLL